MVDLCFFLRRQFATIGGAVIADFLVDARLIFLPMRGFTGGQLSALHALRDAVLLVFLRWPTSLCGAGSGVALWAATGIANITSAALNQEFFNCLVIRSLPGFIWSLLRLWPHE